jgi:hypothetical protein
VLLNYDSLRGDGLDFLILDEYASIDREAWPEVLRPALADKQGRALFIARRAATTTFMTCTRRPAKSRTGPTFSSLRKKVAT